MILFDTSVIIDARDPSSPWHRWAQERIADAVSTEGGAINTVILGEACVRATHPESVAQALQKLGLNLLPLPIAAAIPAAKAFALYLDRLKKEGQTTSEQNSFARLLNRCTRDKRSVNPCNSRS